MILVDDGSPDNCPAICDKHALKDHRIKVIHKTNGGLCSARNAGLDAASGDYVTFVDSDDWIEHDAYKPLIRYCAEKSIRYNREEEYRYIRPWKTDNKILETPFDQAFKLLTSEEALNELYFGGQMFMPMSIMVWNKIYKRSLFDNLRFAEGYIHEDVLMTPILLDKAKRIGTLNHLMYNYNIHLGASSTSGMSTSLHKVESMVKMTQGVYRHFQGSDYHRIAHRTAGQYFNALLNAYYICRLSQRKGIDWRDKMKEYGKTIANLRPLIQSSYPSKPYKIFYISPLLFMTLKRSTIAAKKWRYLLQRFLTGKN